MDFPKFMYRRGDGAAALFKTEEHFEGMKDKHLWQEEPWRPSKIKFCPECENLKLRIKNLEDEMVAKDKMIESSERLIESLQETTRPKRMPKP
jgi:hypothetical protein